MTAAERGEIEGGFSRRAVRWLTGIALGSFALAILLTAFGEDLNGRPSPGPNSFSYSAVGHRAVVELLRTSGIGVLSRRSSVRGRGGRPDTQRPLVLAEPLTEGRTASARLHALRDEAQETGASLVLVLPKWASREDPLRPEWVQRVALYPVGEVAKAPAALDLPGLDSLAVNRPGGKASLACSAPWDRSAPAPRVELSRAQLLVPCPELVPIVACGGGLLVARFAPPAGPEVFVISDPDLLNNHGLARGGNAALVLDFFSQILHARGVIFDETVHGLLRRAGLLAEALRFPLVLAVLQTLVLAGVVVWAGSGRFGKPLPAAAEELSAGGGKAVLIDNTALLLAHGGHAAESLARYYRQTLRSVGAACFLPPDLPEAALTAGLQKIAGRRGLHLDLQAFERRIARLGGGRSRRLDEDRAVRLARALHHWRNGMLGPQRDDERKGDREEKRHGHREHP